MIREKLMSHALWLDRQNVTDRAAVHLKMFSHNFNLLLYRSSNAEKLSLKYRNKNPELHHIKTVKRSTNRILNCDV